MIDHLFGNARAGALSAVMA